MSDVTTKPKAKAASFAATEMPKFEIPRFDLPKFEVPKMEVPAAFREFAEKSVTQAKDNWEKMKAATEEASDLIEDSYATASKGAADYGLKVIEVSRANTNSAFDFAAQLFDREVAGGGGRAFDLAYAQAVRHDERAEQGAHRARPEGHDRDRRADQGKRHQRLQEGRLIDLRAPRAAWAATRTAKPGPQARAFFMLATRRFSAG